MVRDLFDISNTSSSPSQMMNIEKFVDIHGYNVTIGSLLSYTIILENNSEIDLESVCVIEDLISGLKYKKGTLKINGIKPYGGDIDLDDNVIIPIGMMRAKSENCYTNSKIVITFNVIVDKVPCQHPIFNYARVVFKYYKGENCLTGIATSNKVLVNFDLPSKDNYEIVKLIGNSTVLGKGLGDDVQFKVFIRPNESIENVVLCDYLDSKLELVSIKIVRDGIIKNVENPNPTSLNIGYIECGEIIEVIINTKIKDIKNHNCNECNSGCEIITNQASIKYIDRYDRCSSTMISNKVYLYVYYAYLNATKYANKESVNIGDIVTYKINLKHCGSVIIENIILKDLLPESLEYVKDSAEIIYYSDEFKSNIDYNPKTGIINIPVIDIGEEVIVLLKAKVVSGPSDDSNKIINEAYLTYSYLRNPEEKDPKDQYCTIENQLITKTEPICINIADLLSTLKKEASSVCDCSCSSIKYKISFTNTGSLCAKNIILKDYISESASIDTNSIEVITNKPHGPKQYGGNLPNITISEVYPGETISILFNAIVDSGQGEFVVENYANISYEYCPSSSKRPIKVDGNTNTTKTKVIGRKITSNLTIDTTQNANIEMGQEALFKVEIKNTSSQELTNVLYSLRLSEGYSQYISYKEGSLTIKGGTPPTTNINPNNAPISLGTIKPFETVIIEFVEVGLKTTISPITVYLEGKYSYKEGQQIVSCKDTTNQATIKINSQMIQLLKEAYTYCPPQQIGCVPRKISTASPGERITYKITINNLSTKYLEDVTLEDILPKGVDYVSNSARINGKPVSDNLFPIIYIGSISQGEIVIVELDVVVDENISSLLVTNKACIEYFYTTDPTTCKRNVGKSCTINNTEIKGPNFRNSFAKYVEKVGQVEEFKAPNDIIDYIIQFKNEGNEDAFNVILSDIIPEEVGYFLGSLIVKPSVPADNIKQPSGNDRLLQIKFDTVPKGQVCSVRWSSPIKPKFTQGDIVNNSGLSYSYVSDSSGQIKNDSIVSNNVVTYVKSAQLGVVKSATPNIADINVPINYKIVIKNTGNVIANNVFLRDFLPVDNLEYIPNTLRVNGLPTSYDINTGILIGSLGVYNPITDSPKIVVTYQLVSKIPPALNPISNIANATYTFTSNPFTNKEVNSLATSNQALVTILAADLEFITPKKSSSEFIISNTDPAKNSANYEINLVNYGNTTALNVVIQDTLPNGLDFVANTVKVVGYDKNGATIPLKVSSIPPGGPLNIENGIKVDSLPPDVRVATTYTYIAKSTAKGFIDNIAQYSYSYVTSETIINKPNNNTDKATILVVEDLLDVKKSVAPTNYCPGQTLLYTMNIRNISGGTINNATFQDTIPASTELVPGSFIVDFKPFTINGDTVTKVNLANGVNLGTIPFGGAKAVQFQVKVNESSTPTTISNTGIVGFQSITIPSKAYKSTVVATKSNICKVPPLKPIEMTKTAFSYCPPELVGCTPKVITSAGVGDRVTYKVTVSNVDTSTVSNVIFKDIIPAETSFIQNTVKVNGALIPNTNPSNIDLGTIPTNTTYIVEFDVLINSIPNNNKLINTANTNYKYFINCPSCTLTDGSSSTTNNVIVSSPDLLSSLKKYVGKTGITNNTVSPGGSVPYIIQFTNTGNEKANNVVLSDIIPSQLVYTAGSVYVLPTLPDGSIIEPTPENNKLTINFGTVENNQSYTIKFDTTASTIASGNIVNSATLNYSYTSNSSGQIINVSGTSNQTLTTINTANVQMTKSVIPKENDLNTPIAYTITLANTGNVTVNNLFVSDVLPPYLSYIKNTLTVNGVTISSSPENGILLGSLGIYNSITKQPIDVIKFDVLATSIPQTNPVINIADATYTYVVDQSTGKEVNGSTKSNEAEVSIFAADLLSVSPTKVSNKKIFSRNDISQAIGEYTVTLFNSGNKSALNVKIFDTLPNGTKFVPQSVTVTGYDKTGQIVPLVVNSILPGSTLNIEKGIVIEQIPPNVKVLTQYSYVVQSDAPKQIDNTASFDYSYISSNTIVNKLNNSTNTETIFVVDGQNGLSKVSSPTEVCPGQSVVYTIVMDNTFGSTISNAILQDTIPCGTNFVDSSFTLNFKPLSIDSKPVKCRDLEKGINIGTIPAGGKIIAQYQAIVSCKCHPNPVINKANLYYNGGTYSAVSTTTVVNHCICNCNQYCNLPHGTEYDVDCSMCWNQKETCSSEENLYNKSSSKNTQSSWKRIGKNTARLNKQGR